MGKMATLIKTSVFAVLMLVLWLQSPAVEGTEAAKAKDIAIVLDVSGSMEENWIIDDVRTWLLKELVQKRLATGDRFTLIAFGSSVREVFSMDVQHQRDIKEIAKKIAALRTKDHFTDIGAGLEGLDRHMAATQSGDRSSLAVFITDGKNAPPDYSSWYGKDLSIDEHFKDIGQRIAQKGWLLFVIGLLDDTDAKVVAQALPGSTLAEGEKALDGEVFDEFLEEKNFASEGKKPIEEIAEAEFEEGKQEEPDLSYRFDGETSEDGRAREKNDLPIPLLAVSGALLFLVMAAILSNLNRPRRKAEPKEKKMRIPAKKKERPEKKKKLKPPKAEKTKKERPPKKKKQGVERAESIAGSEQGGEEDFSLDTDAFNFDIDPDSGPSLASPAEDDDFSSFSLD